MALSSEARRRIAERVDQIGREAAAWAAGQARQPRALADVLQVCTLKVETQPQALPEFLRVARLQLHAQIAAACYRGAGSDAECDLRGLVIFLATAEEMADALVGQLRAGAQG